MIAPVLHGPREVRFEARPLPKPGPRQIRVRLEGCGVCGSNLPVWEGRPWFEYPLQAGAPGHEGWGIVDLVGEHVEHFSPGDRVACLSYHAFAPYDLVDAEQAIVLPEALDGQPFPGEPLACAVNAFRRCQISAGETVVVIGIGFLGALLVQLAKDCGAHVVAISRRQFARDIADRCGADATVELSEAAASAVQETLQGRDCDCVIEATGLQQALDLATDLVRIRGRMVIAGFHQDGKRHVDMQQWNWKGIDVVNAHERDPQIYMQGMQQAVDYVVAGRIQLSPLLTHQYGWQQFSDAFEAATRRADGFLKSLVLFRQD